MNFILRLKIYNFFLSKKFVWWDCLSISKSNFWSKLVGSANRQVHQIFCSFREPLRSFTNFQIWKTFQKGNQYLKTGKVYISLIYPSEFCHPWELKKCFNFNFSHLPNKFIIFWRSINIIEYFLNIYLSYVNITISIRLVISIGLKETYEIFFFYTWIIKKLFM